MLPCRCGFVGGSPGRSLRGVALHSAEGRKAELCTVRYGAELRNAK